MTDDDKILLVAKCREEEGREAAQRLWVTLGLPVVTEMYREMQRRKAARSRS